MKKLIFLLSAAFFCVGSQAQKIIKLPDGLQFSGEQSHINSYSVLGTSDKDLKLVIREGVYPELQKLPPISELQKFIPISLHIQSYQMAQQNGKLCYFLQTGKRGRDLWMLFGDGKLEKPLAKQSIKGKFRAEVTGKSELDLSLWPYADIPVNNGRPECRFENNFVYDVPDDSIRDLHRPSMTRKAEEAKPAETPLYQPVQYRDFTEKKTDWQAMIQEILTKEQKKNGAVKETKSRDNKKAGELKKILNGNFEEKADSDISARLPSRKP